MSASNEWTEWHLTPRGWERGTEKEDFKKVDREPPTDRVLTAKHRQHLSSTYSKMDITNEILWRGEDEALTKKLLDAFGPPPEHL